MQTLAKAAIRNEIDFATDGASHAPLKMIVVIQPMTTIVIIMAMAFSFSKTDLVAPRGLTA